MGLKEPFNSISHMVGAGLSVAGLVILVILADGALEIVSAAIYGAGLIALYTMSSLYHAIPAGPRLEKWLERLDHVAIYLLIAGTYTPVTLVLFGGGWGWSIFGTVWGISLVGIVLALTLPLGPSWLHTVGYIALGWVALVAAPVLISKLTGIGLTLLITGGVLYTAGAALYAWNKPRIIGPMGAHEMWHIMVLAGSGTHFAFVLLFVF